MDTAEQDTVTQFILVAALKNGGSIPGPEVVRTLLTGKGGIKQPLVSLLLSLRDMADQKLVEYIGDPTKDITLTEDGKILAGLIEKRMAPKDQELPVAERRQGCFCGRCPKTPEADYAKPDVAS